MTEYRISQFSTNTPKAEQSKLEKNLKAMSGVESVTLHPERHGISISYLENHKPKDGELETAVSKAGFSLDTKR